MKELIKKFRPSCTDMEWKMITLSLLLYILYKVGYQVGKFCAHLTN